MRLLYGFFIAQLWPSPTLANVFLCHHENRWLAECPKEFWPLFFERYMDDTFALFKDHTQIYNFLDYLNNKHSNLKFTCEVEENSRLSFLDCYLERTNDKIISSVFRKATYTGQGLHYLSFMVKNFKINSIRTWVNRAYVVSGNLTNFHKELSYNNFSITGFHVALSVKK